MFLLKNKRTQGQVFCHSQFLDADRFQEKNNTKSEHWRRKSFAEIFLKKITVNRVNIRVRSFSSEIFIKKMRVYRLKKANDRQMAPLGRGVASPWLRSNVVKLASLQLAMAKANLNESSSASRSEHPAQSKC